jgi:hypothetical protein
MDNPSALPEAVAASVTIDDLAPGATTGPVVAPALDLGLRRVLAAALELAATLALDEVALPPALRRLTGELRGAPRTLTTRRFRGAALADLTVAEIRDEAAALCAVTVIGRPEPASLRPVLGVDLVALGGALGLVAVDLAPTDPALWAERAAPALDRLHRAAGPALVPRRWPEFAAEVFSPRALIAGARRGDEGPALAAVAAFVGEVAPLYAASAPADPARAAEAAERAARWRAAERRNRREHDALARLFGAAPAAAYLELLFPP